AVGVETTVSVGNAASLPLPVTVIWVAPLEPTPRPAGASALVSAAWSSAGVTVAAAAAATVMSGSTVPLTVTRIFWPVRSHVVAAATGSIVTVGALPTL